MLVNKLHLENWGIFRAPVNVEFDEGINIVYGANETGKSTLIDAIRILLFTKHNTKSGKIAALQPWQSSGMYPRGYIIFSHNGEKYKLCKEFFVSRSILERLIDNQWQRIAEGDAADIKTVELIGGKLPSRGDTKPEFWGIGQTLWMIQGQPSLSGSINEETLSSIRNLLGVTIETDLGRQLFDAIRKKYDAIFTGKTKQYKKNSEILRLKEKINSLEEEFSRIKEAKSQKELLIVDISRTEELVAEEKHLFNSRSLLVNQLENNVSQAYEHKRQREQSEQDINDLTSKYNSLHKTCNSIVETEKQIKEMQEKNQQLASDKDAALLTLNSKIAPQYKNIREELNVIENKIETTESAISQLRLAEEILEYKKEIDEISSIIDELKEKQSQIKSLEEELSGLKAPDKNELKNMENICDNLRELKAKLDVIGLNIRVSAEQDISGHISSDTQNENISIHKGETVSHKAYSNASIKIDNTATIEISSGSEDVKTLSKDLEKYEIEYGKLTAPYGCKDISILREMTAKKESLQQELKKRKNEVKKHFKLSSATDINEKLEKLILSEIKEQAAIKEKLELSKKKLHRDSTASQYIEYSDIKLAKKHISEEIERLSENIKKLKKEYKNLQKKEKELADTKNKLEQSVNNIEKEIHGNSSRVAEKQENMKKLQSEHGSIEEIKDKLADMAVELERKKIVYDKLKAEVEEKELLPLKEYDTATKELEKIKKRIHDAENTIAEKKGSLNTIIANMQDPAAIQEELELLTNKYQSLLLEVNSIALLYDLMNFYKERMASTLTTPVGAIINRDMANIFGHRYDKIKISQNILPEAVNVTGFDTEAPIDFLSYGAKEQLWFLFRLALGELLSKEEKQLVVLDDPLRHTDSGRINGALDVLKIKSLKMQIIVVTCEITKYNTLSNAKLIPAPTTLLK